MDNIITKFQSYISQMWFKYFAIFIVGICISQAGGWTSANASTALNENFDSGYTVGEIDGQNGWTGGLHSVGMINTTEAQTSPNSLSARYDTYWGGAMLQKTITPNTTDTDFSFNIKAPDLYTTGSDYAIVNLSGNYGDNFYICIQGTSTAGIANFGIALNFDCTTGVVVIGTNIDMTTWHNFYFHADFTAHTIQAKLDSDVYSSTISINSLDTTFGSGLTIYDMIANNTSTIYFDDFGGLLYTTPTIGITTTTPAPNATNVNAYTHFTGTYDNDGTYTSVWISETNLDATNSPINLHACDVTSIGINLSYSCNISLSTDTHYQYLPFLFNKNGTGVFEEDSVFDTEGPYFFTTGLVYEVQTPAVSSTCGTLDVGCYLENAISWTFGISQNTLNQFTDLTLENSIPFSYIYDIGNIFNELFANTGSQTYAVSAHTSLGDINFISSDMISAVPFASTIKTILGYLIYFFTAMSVYRIVLNTFNSKHTS